MPKVILNGYMEHLSGVVLLYKISETDHGVFGSWFNFLFYFNRHRVRCFNDGSGDPIAVPVVVPSVDRICDGK